MPAQWLAKGQADYATFFAPRPNLHRSIWPLSPAFLRERLPEDVVLTSGAGNFAVWPNKCRFGPRARTPRRGRAPWATACLRPSRPRSPTRVAAWSATGDGDFQMTVGSWQPRDGRGPSRSFWCSTAALRHHPRASGNPLPRPGLLLGHGQPRLRGAGRLRWEQVEAQPTSRRPSNAPWRRRPALSSIL